MEPEVGTGIDEALVASSDVPNRAEPAVTLVEVMEELTPVSFLNWTVAAIGIYPLKQKEDEGRRSLRPLNKVKLNFLSS